VTNREFAAFAEGTGYVTVAERPLDPADFPGAPPEHLVPGSLVFTCTDGPVDLRHLSQWWKWTPGACWRRPEGPGSSLDGRGDHPVVHVAFEDAESYAAWAGKSLPSEAQWELAARGGRDGAQFTWGDEPELPGRPLANHWRGAFPWRPDAGSGTTAPVGSFMPNGFGLFDMAGNVWEWTADWYQEHGNITKACCTLDNPRGGRREESIDPGMPDITIPRRVMKGGSYLCAANYCHRYRPAARMAQPIDTSTCHVGFRCIVREGV
jgi:formylglycine-generating enzyme